MSGEGCEISGCIRGHYAHGWCNTHYMRWRKHGDPTKVLVHQGDALARLRAKYQVDPGSGCWVWHSEIQPGGYGRFWFNRASGYAHIASYELLVGPIPKGLHLDHLCHTRDLTCDGGWECKHRRCVNPEHLQPVTRLENVRRGHRNNPGVRKTHCPKGHPYSGPNLYVSPRGDRMCRACRRSSDRRRRSVTLDAD
jgi:hypothetical protein